MTSRDSPRQTGGSRAITSLQNERVKLIRSLEMRKARRETGLFVVEGTSVLISAREQGWKPRFLVHGPDARENETARGLCAWAKSEGAEGLDVSAAVLEKLASKENPQSLMGVFAQRWTKPPEVARIAPEAVWLALEAIRDPGNLGTIIRTVDAAGAAGVILIGSTCDPYSREAVRASMGSIFAVPLVRLESPEFVELARAWTGDVVGAHLRATTDFRTARYRVPTLLLMGSEGAGLSDAAAGVCRALVRIPMSGRLDSLNLAVATALMLYQIRGPMLRI